MKGIQSFRHAYVSIPLLFLLVISPSAILATTGVSSPSVSTNSAIVACNNSDLDAQVVRAEVPFTQQSAVALTESSSAYLNAVAGYSASLSGVGNLWKYDSTCIVSWYGFAVSYRLEAANGSEYLLTLGANPGTSAVFGVKVIPFAFASLPDQYNSTSYSGYAIAASSDNKSAVAYTTAVWYVPTISAPSGNCGDNSISTPLSCDLAVWTGLQNSSYDGTNHLVNHGEVIQTGTEASCYTYCDSSHGLTYGGFSMYLNGEGSTIKQQAINGCPSNFSVGAGTEINAVVGTGYAINGTSSSTYYTIMSDYTGVLCEAAYNSSTTCYPPNSTSGSACKIAGTEYWADYFAETPQDPHNANFYTYMLPDFSNFDFYDMGMISTTQGSYPYYNDGYYLSSPMVNSNVYNTNISTVSENSGSTYAYFSETYKSSSNTGVG
jgi:hypothetical protein